jgi:hypothetical protein
MPTTLKTFTAVMLLISLGGCVGAAGISTWGYRSGPGYDTARIQDSRIQVDSARGVTRETCASESRRQMASSGDIRQDDLSVCRSN